MENISGEALEKEERALERSWVVELKEQRGRVISEKEV